MIQILKPKIYCASKTKHAHLWITLRSAGHLIISTWIDEAGEGQTKDYGELSDRCLSEIAACDLLLLYCESQDILKGALIEVGAALALGIEVRSVGIPANHPQVFYQHRLWRRFPTLPDAIAAERWRDALADKARQTVR